ncbi:hypothetical protein EJ02DRAFT_458045 [Clathrospora elynae]|uniref:Uncharacterized protein n=1 Tax=Clathrospora elynae TaxID=706981 RepID=A0A6A5SDX3_9PLEO|nr:hypothetical protein EJ02DRAFT_458045 [Clathrospora elynae]
MNFSRSALSSTILILCSCVCATHCRVMLTADIQVHAESRQVAARTVCLVVQADQ